LAPNEICIRIYIYVVCIMYIYLYIYIYIIPNFIEKYTSKFKTNLIRQLKVC
jgi:hypothetical protein